MLRNGSGKSPPWLSVGKCQPACKPGSVRLASPLAGRWMTIHLGRAFRAPRATYPGDRRKTGPGPCGPRHPYLVLLRAGFAMPPLLPAARCALTAPFHPYRGFGRGLRRFAFCGTVPGVTPAGVTRRPVLSGARTFLPACEAAAVPADWHGWDMGIAAPGQQEAIDILGKRRARSTVRGVPLARLRRAAWKVHASSKCSGGPSGIRTLRT